LPDRPSLRGSLDDVLGRGVSLAGWWSLTDTM